MSVKSKTIGMIAGVVLGLATAAATFVGFSTTGCAGNAARDNALVPSLSLASGALENDVRAGFIGLQGAELAAADANATAFFEAVRSGDRARILAAQPLWVELAAYAQVGIVAKENRGEIGPNGAKELQLRVQNIGAKLGTLAGPVVVPK